MFCFIREILISLYGITLNLEFEQGRGHKIWSEKKAYYIKYGVWIGF